MQTDEQGVAASDLAELEQMLAESGAGALQDIERATSESRGLGLFVRSLVGMDREAAKGALAGFLAGKTLGAHPEGLFSASAIDELIAALDEVRRMAAAA